MKYHIEVTNFFPNGPGGFLLESAAKDYEPMLFRSRGAAERKVRALRKRDEREGAWLLEAGATTSQLPDCPILP